MRVTIRLDDELLASTKQLALQTGRTLTAVIEDALREVLARHQNQKKKDRVRLTTVKGKGLLPGVDLDDVASLFPTLRQGSSSTGSTRHFAQPPEEPEGVSGQRLQP